jgi:hypothetical protein
VLAELDAELPGAGRRFAADFARLWEHRRARIARAVAEGLREEALDSVLSLKVSSMMVGAQPLACKAARLEAVLRSRQGDTQRLYEEIAVCGSVSVSALRAEWLRGAED